MLTSFILFRINAKRPDDLAAKVMFPNDHLNTGPSPPDQIRRAAPPLLCPQIMDLVLGSVHHILAEYLMTDDLSLGSADNLSIHQSLSPAL